MELLPLIAFTILSGTAAGTIFVSLFVRLTSHWTDRVFPLTFTCLILLGLGLLATLAHLGQPLRFINGLSNPNSMISQESYWSIAFMILLLACTVQSLITRKTALVLHILCAIAGFGVMVVTSLAYFFAAGIPAWSDALTIPFFLISDLLLGCAVCLLFLSNANARRVLISVTCMLLVLQATVTAALGLHLLDTPSVDYTILLAIAVAVTVTLPLVLGFLMLPKGKKSSQTTQRVAAIAFCLLIVCGIVITRSVFFASGIHL